jgi:threonine/homoserine/homoserine lactone efflux protein
LISAILAGAVLGLSSGLAPGPLLTLVIAQTLRHGPKEGMIVAVAPLITDVPIVLLALLVVGTVGRYGALPGILSLCGGMYVFYLAWETFRSLPAGAGERMEAPRSIRKGAFVNFLNPHPYLFWITVGVPMILRAKQEGTVEPLLFVGSFYVLLVGSKVVVALLTGKARGFLGGRAYRWIMKTLAALLVLFALFLLREGLRLLVR